jgi:hypothetical protein
VKYPKCKEFAELETTLAVSLKTRIEQSNRLSLWSLLASTERGVPHGELQIIGPTEPIGILVKVLAVLSEPSEAGA